MTNRLNHLSDADLLKYHQLYKQMLLKSKRYESIKRFNMDVKFAYHLVRLLNEIEQILIEGDLELGRNREQLKAIRRGEWTQEQIRDYFASKERELETVYTESKLRHRPDMVAIKTLLLACLEEHYGSLAAIAPSPGRERQLLQQIKREIEGAGY